MPSTIPEVKAGDVCPIDGGAFVPDVHQDAEKAIDRHTRNSPSPAVAARYAEQVREKVKEHGVIHRCVTCGYQSRFVPAEATKPDRAALDAADTAAGRPITRRRE